MTAKEAAKVKVGDHLWPNKRYYGQWASGADHFTVKDVIKEHDDPKVRVPLFVMEEMGSYGNLEITYLLLERERISVPEKMASLE